MPARKKQTESQTAARAKKEDRTEEPAPETTTTTTTTEEATAGGTERAQQEHDPNQQKTGEKQKLAHHDPDTLGRKIERMMDEEEARKETARHPQNTRIRKKPKTKSLPNKTITRKLKTKKTAADLERQGRKKKAMDDEEAATRQTQNQINEAKKPRK